MWYDTMAYYELEKVRPRCNIDNGDITFDTILNDFGLSADNEVDDFLYKWAAKNRVLSQLPAVPLTNPPQNIKDASSNRIVAKWWRKQQNWDAAKEAQDESDKAIMQYIERLKVDVVRYGVIV